MKHGVDFWKILNEVMPFSSSHQVDPARAQTTLYPSHWFRSVLIPTLDQAATVFAQSPHKLLLHRSEWTTVGTVASLQFWIYDQPEHSREIGEIRRRTSKYSFVVPDGRIVEVRTGRGHMVRDGGFANPVELLGAQPVWVGSVVSRALREIRDMRQRR